MKPLENPPEQVQRAALSILNRFGYGALSMTEVARYLKVSKQRIYYHYPGNEEVLLQLATKWSESGQFFTLKALADSRESGAYRVKAMAAGMFDWMEADPELAQLGLVLYQLAPHVKKLGVFMEKARLAGRERARSLLLLETRLQTLSNKELEALVTALHSHMYGFFFYAVAMNKQADLKAARENCLSGLQELLKARLKAG